MEPEQSSFSSSDSNVASPFYSAADIVKCEYGDLIHDEYFLLLRFDQKDSWIDANRELWYTLNLCDGTYALLSFHKDEDMVIA